MLSWFCTHSPPNAIWCLPRTQVTSSSMRRGVVVEVRDGVGAAADGELAFRQLQAIGHGLVRRFDMPSVAALMSFGAYPRLSTRRRMEMCAAFTKLGVMV